MDGGAERAHSSHLLGREIKTQGRKLTFTLSHLLGCLCRSSLQRQNKDVLCFVVNFYLFFYCSTTGKNLGSTNTDAVTALPEILNFSAAHAKLGVNSSKTTDKNMLRDAHIVLTIIKEQNVLR